MANWYAIATWTGREFDAVEELSGFCREVVCPTFREIRRKTDRQRTKYKVDVALLPGYIFAVVPDSAWDALHDAKAVCGVVSLAGEPTPILGRSEAALTAFLRRADNGEFDMQGTDERVKVGDVLRVLFGPWEGHEVHVIGKGAHTLDCEADFELFGRKPRMTVDYESVQPVIATSCVSS